MGESDSVILNKNTVKIEGDRNLYNYTFTVRDTPYEDFLHIIDSGDAKRAFQFLEGHPHLPMNLDTSAYSPLHMAAKHGLADLIPILVQRGGALDLEDTEYGSTPLGWAAFFGQPAAAEALMRAGARVTSNSIENAKAGIEGRLSEVADAPKEQYEAVLALLEKGLPDRG